MKKLKVLSVNISDKKGTVKHPVPSITLTENGVEGDAHSGPWNRQVSLLGMESIRKFEKEANRKINYGEFAENITTAGLELWKCKPLDRFVGQEVELEVTQIGKECHGTSCAIFKEVGTCVMPKEGIFARVAGGGQW
ncbi:MAG: molybdenum cofactor synthesis protein, partial [Bacteroidota bacterium]